MEEQINFNKLQALHYLVDNSVYGDEWSGAGMYHAVSTVIDEDDNLLFAKEYLDKLLEKAKNF
jgi:hypothetical protein